MKEFRVCAVIKRLFLFLEDKILIQKILRKQVKVSYSFRKSSHNFKVLKIKSHFYFFLISAKNISLPSHSSVASFHEFYPLYQQYSLTFQHINLIMDLSKRQISLRDKYFPKDSYKNKLIQEFTSFGVANVFARTLLAPLERWRNIAQIQNAYPLRPKKFKNFMEFLKRIPKEQGIASFWRGNMLHCWIYFYQVTFQTLFFDNINVIKKLWLEESQQMPWLQKIQQNFFIPFFSSIFGLTVIYPLDTYRIHTTMSYHKNKADAPFTKFRYFVSAIDSVKNLYGGFWIAVMMSILQFNFYRNLAGVFRNDNPTEDDSISEIFSPEFIVSVLGVGLLHPLDTFRKMIQFNNMYKPALFKNYRAVFKRLNENKSYGSLYNGFTASLMRTGLFVPVYWAILKQWNQICPCSSPQKQNNL